MLVSDNHVTEQVGSIRSARHDAGLSQEQLARRADCSTAYVRLIEAGYAPGRSDVIPRVLRALGLKTGEKRPSLSLNESSPAGKPGSTKTTDAGGRCAKE
jgi:ribosome-binding protein aMBF1 (putative translation factor)